MDRDGLGVAVTGDGSESGSRSFRREVGSTDGSLRVERMVSAEYRW